jgi:hypothetical protein
MISVVDADVMSYFIPSFLKVDCLQVKYGYLPEVPDPMTITFFPA